jgi:secreted PhoX family phosphatase
MEGQLVQIPGFGLSAWENLIPTPNKGKTTAVMGMEDGAATDSQLWMYQGSKTKTGAWYDKAGFTNGSAYVLAQDPSAAVANDNEIRANYGKNKPFKVTFAKIDATLNGKAQNDQAREKGIELARVEDGSFDPKNPNDFYFVTTESNKDPKATASNPATPTVSRDGGGLWRLRFADVTNPAKGGTLELLLDGSEAPLLSKPDNMTVDIAGNVLIQEDPGNNALVARIVSYRIKDGAVGVVAKFKDEYFAEGAASFITKDEESSGIIDVTEFFTKGKTDKNRYYMYVAQVHGAIANARPDVAAGDTTLPKAIEAGQWYLMTISDWAAVYTK